MEVVRGCGCLLPDLARRFALTSSADRHLGILSHQVTGYVLIVGVHADYVPLTSLQIIRGKTLFHYVKTNDDYSLYVALNYDKNSNVGLKELRFTSLQGKRRRWWWCRGGGGGGGSSSSSSSTGSGSSGSSSGAVTMMLMVVKKIVVLLLNVPATC